MSVPPPPPGPVPSPYGAPPPPGYQQYGAPPSSSQTNGMSVASLVLGLVNVIPCFWLFPLPALLAVIFGFVGRSQIKRSGARGAGLAIAGLILGIVFIAIAVAFWAYLAHFDHCVRDGGRFTCYND